MIALRRFFIVFSVCLPLFLTGCTHLQEVRVLDYNIESLGLDRREIEAIIKVKVDNPAKQLTFTDIEGRICLGEEEIAVYRALPFIVAGRTVDSYPLTCKISVSDHISLLKFLSMVKTARLDDLSTDLKVRVKIKGGLKKKIRLDDVPVKNLISRRHE